MVESAGVFQKFLPLLLVELRIVAKFGKITLHTCSGCVPLIYFQLENYVDYFSVNQMSRCLSAECFAFVSGNYLGEEEKRMRKILSKDKWNHWNDEKIRQR